MATPFPFTAGQVLTAAELNGIGETWTSYTPTVTSSGGTITTVGAVSAAYTQVNKIVFVYVSIVITTVGTASGQLQLTRSCSNCRDDNADINKHYFVHLCICSANRADSCNSST